ncbi:sigma-70 family RNA polymerase sigma factor [Paludisphaera sp.]|uniref:sigma-70 family RNA polymerase sigma factor n=1 Tax=Paludisphaera sp. TaxID=2017432 RepID=UPI00301D6F97
MKRGGRGGWIGSIQALYDEGTLAGLGDAELLGAFLGRGDASRGAFEAIVARHAAMVLDVCRAAAGSEADAEDAFQATFLVLACRASSVRDRASLGPWLFGVARRLAARARADAARRRASERRAAGLRPASSGPTEPDDAVAMLMEEVDRLPARYRDPVVLCQLQGLTYEAAARQLGCPLGTLSIRLRRAKERLRRNLEGRGVGGAWALARVADPAVPKALASSAARLGSLVAPTLGAGVPAPIMSLTRGALTTMKIRRLARFSIAFLALAAGAWGWNAVASHDEPPPATEKRPARYQVTGRVVDEDGRPAAGALVQALTRDPATGKPAIKSARSGADGMYALDLPPGHVGSVSFVSPPGCWRPNTPTLAALPMYLSNDRPTIRADYKVERGMAWDFLLSQGGRPPDRGGVGSEPFPDLQTSAYVESDADGLARLGIPRDRREAKLLASSVGSQWRSVPCSIRWDEGFRPEAVRSVARLDGTLDRFWVTDADGRSAMLEAAPDGRFRPEIDGGRLVIRVDLPEVKETLPAVEGSIVDRDGKPIAGARVEAAYTRDLTTQVGEGDAFATTTDSRGRYRLDRLPASVWGRKPTSIRLVVTKDGFSGIDSDPIPVEGAAGPIAVPSIVLEPGCSVTGVVLGPDGRPLEGAEVEPGHAFSARARVTWTDAEGRFTAVGLPEGPARLDVRFGTLNATVETAAERDPRPIEVRLQGR